MKKKFDSLEDLLTLPLIRQRSRKIFDWVKADKSSYFSLHLEKLEDTADFVCALTKKNYPDLSIPLHSRLRHFEVIPYVEEILPRDGVGLFDLIIPSVLIDAGAGKDYCYQDKQTGKTYTRSEALAVASLRGFREGVFSSSQKPQTDYLGLKNLSLKTLSQVFQVSEQNPLIGLEDRLLVLQRLSKTMEKLPQIFAGDNPRLGVLFNYFYQKAEQNGMQLSAQTIFSLLMELLIPGWPDGLIVKGIPLGDVGRHAALSALDDTSELVPFHKLTQWLSYSLMEPLLAFNVSIQDQDLFTGLPEYRNGGLFLDGGVLALKSPRSVDNVFKQTDEMIVEWRALTLCLLDELLILSRKKLFLENLTMGQLLQGGSWLAGRAMAFQKRPGGEPPLKIMTTGTLF